MGFSHYYFMKSVVKNNDGDDEVYKYRLRKVDLNGE